jgi:hypothetical protein
MTTMTINALNSSATFGSSSFKKPTFAGIRAVLPADGSLFAQSLEVAARAALAAVPFAVIGWMFIAL